MHITERYCLLLLVAAVNVMGAPQNEASVIEAGIKAKEAEKQPFLGGFLNETRIVYPLKLGAWQAQGEHLFDVPEMGVSVRYQNDKFADRWIDVYFYAAGQLPADAFERAARKTASEIETVSLQASGRSGFEMGPLNAFTIVIDKDSEIEELKSVPARSVALSFRKEDVAFSSSMAMAVHDLYFIKVRYSVEEHASTRGVARKQVEDFLGDIVRSTKIVSTGDCWMPLPITKIEPGSQPPKDAQGVVKLKDKQEAHVYQDHIAAYDPDSPIAKIAMMMIMRENGQFFWGCDSPDRMNQEIGKDMREIRLEYRVPSEDSADPSRSLPLKRSGIG